MFKLISNEKGRLAWWQWTVVLFVVSLVVVFCIERYETAMMEIQQEEAKQVLWSIHNHQRAHYDSLKGYVGGGIVADSLNPHALEELFGIVLLPHTPYTYALYVHPDSQSYSVEVFGNLDEDKALDALAITSEGVLLHALDDVHRK